MAVPGGFTEGLMAGPVSGRGLESELQVRLLWLGPVSMLSSRAWARG